MVSTLGGCVPPQPDLLTISIAWQRRPTPHRARCCVRKRSREGFMVLAIAPNPDHRKATFRADTVIGGAFRHDKPRVRQLLQITVVSEVNSRWLRAPDNQILSISQRVGAAYLAAPILPSRPWKQPGSKRARKPAANQRVGVGRRMRSRCADHLQAIPVAPMDRGPVRRNLQRSDCLEAAGLTLRAVRSSADRRTER